MAINYYKLSLGTFGPTTKTWLKHEISNPTSHTGIPLLKPFGSAHLAFVSTPVGLFILTLVPSSSHLATQTYEERVAAAEKPPWGCRQLALGH